MKTPTINPDEVLKSMAAEAVKRTNRRCSEITIAICRRSGGTGGSATMVGRTRPVPYRLRRKGGR